VEVDRLTRRAVNEASGLTHLPTIGYSLTPPVPKRRPSALLLRVRLSQKRVGIRRPIVGLLDAVAEAEMSAKVL